MAHVEPSGSFHIARAYAPDQGVRTARVGVSALRHADGVHAAQIVRGGAERLIAGVVPGKVEFTPGEAEASGSFPMYRHPADRNAAAVSVHAGRMIDVNA